jgi:RHS repeat-associated protein
MNSPHKSVRAAGKRAVGYLTLLVLLGYAAPTTRAQGTTPERGFNPGGSYAISDIESINTSNGNVGLQIPIASLPAGRGGFRGADLRLIYNSKVWDTPITIVPDGTYNNYGEPQGTPQHYLKASPEGGWRYGAGYEVRFINRLNDYTYSPLAPSCEEQWGTGSRDADFIYKMQVIFPDGSAHEFAPQGYQNPANTTSDGYYNIRPDGYLVACSCHEVWGSHRPSCASPSPVVLSNSGTMTYYSTDGTYMRLDVPHDSDTNPWNNAWTISMPDGTRVVGSSFTGVGGGLQPGYPGSERIYDRNNNYVDIQITQSLISITDQFGRSVSVHRNVSPNVDEVQARGYNNAPLTWTVRWKSVYVRKSYNKADPTSGCPVGQTCMSFVGSSLYAVDRLELPSQSGGLAYSFGYNGSYDSNATTTVGWGELSSLTLPSGASVEYVYRRDNQDNIPWYSVLQNHPTSKALTYSAEYDGSTTQQTDTWSYSFNFSGSAGLSYMTTVGAPDGGLTTDYIKNSNAAVPEFDDGMSYKTVRPDGTVVERVWAANNPYGHFGQPANPYLKTEFISIPDAAGNPSKTAIKDYDYDKNGNLTRASEYDWVAYASTRGASDKPVAPSGLQAKSLTLNTYYAPTQNASDANLADSPNSYSKGSSPRVRSAVASAEVSGDGAGSLSRTEFNYDDPSNTANLTEQKVWDSTRGALARLLSAGTYISVTNQYDAYGNQTLATDARGFKTQTTYGPTGSFGDLYPTQVKSALGTAVERTASYEYDIYSGRVTRATDADNGVSTATTYDPFGRPILMEVADGLYGSDGTSIERRTVTEYSDALRRVVMRADLNATGDGKLVSVMHYDQLGRVRLSRTLEDASTEAAEDENAGVKVQTRYRYDNSAHLTYQLSSNPYRAAYSSGAGGESTMGWTLSTSDRGGRVVRVETFGGAGLPAPFAAGNPNVGSTGAVVTDYDAEKTTVTDQTGRKRRSVFDALGRLTQVFEAPNDAAYNHLTSYSYDALGNLKQVAQGAQTRSFNYSSLSRLTSAQNPESGTTQYQYDAGGNLILKSDPRPRPGGTTLSTCSIQYAGAQVATCHEYDPLGRITTRSYNDGTPNVAYTYDDAAVSYSKGRLTKVSSSMSTYSYTGYDALGRVTASSQTTGGVTYSMPEYKYNLSGTLTSQTYPSGRVVKTEYDASGRTAGVRNQATGLYYAGAGAADPTDRIRYTPGGSPSAVRLGNGLWEHASFNSRLQPTQIGLGTAATNSSVLKLDYTYGELVGGTLDPSRNNGSVQSQAITAPGLATPLVQSYGYDALNRLQTAEERSGAASTWKQVYSYDRYGNRNFAAGTTSPNYSQTPNDPSAGLPVDPVRNPVFDALDNRIKVTAAGQAGYGYDPAGNLLCEPGRLCVQGQSSVTPYYSYDAENKMVSASGGYAGGGTSYFYDGDGRRVRKSRYNGEDTVFVYDAMGKVVAEYSNQVEYKGTRYLTQDSLGSTRVVTDAQGNAHSINGAGGSRHDYFPFGEEVPASVGGRAETIGYEQSDGPRQRFTGQDRDGETGLDYFGARYFHSSHGRFTSPDPLLSSGRVAMPQSWNRYAYALNNPLRYVDPSGLYEYAAGTTDEQKRKFEAALQQAKTKLADIAAFYGTDSEEYEDADRALKAYDAAGVVVKFGTLDKGTQGTTQGTLSATGTNSVVVTIDLKQADTGTELLTTIAHEGSHAKDNLEYQAAALAANNLGSLGLGEYIHDLRPTHGATETKAYGVSSVFAQFTMGGGTGESAISGNSSVGFVIKFDQPPVKSITVGGESIWKSSWQKLDAEEIRSKRSAAIAKGLPKDSRYAPNLDKPIQP